MVNTLSHLGIGLLIAMTLGFKGKKRNILGFLAILPDLDFIPYILFAVVSGSVSHETRNQLFYLLGHREFMHSILFILLVTLLIWLKTKDRLFTASTTRQAGKCAPFTRSAQMHPLWEQFTFLTRWQTSFPYCLFSFYLLPT
jgi:membrane-bound metal-dependent hydrolase YbcI (DUF457 family)